MFPFQHQHILDSFIVPDREDELSAGPSSSPSKSRIYPVPAFRPSRYAQAINTLSQRYGIDEETEEEEEDADFDVLDDIGLWTAVGDWLSGVLNFETLMRKLDFQHGKSAKIAYWEDLVSELACEYDLNKREEQFKAISLLEHHRRLSAYNPASVPSLKSPSPPRSSLRPSTSSNVTQQMPPGPIKIWSVKIVPGEFHLRYLHFSI